LRAAVHLDLDNAWSREDVPFETIDVRRWGPRLRFSAPARLIEKFYREIEAQLAPFILYGSGDFHHLTALWLRRVDQPVTLVSFDNHPDWDIRPPRWGCGGWINRALGLPQVQRVSVWGCGNFECWWPRRIFGNLRAVRKGRLELHPWADNRGRRARERRGAILRQDWQRRFLAFVKELSGDAVYLTIDLDCLRTEDAVTNWENGCFSLDDLEWALCELRHAAQIIAGDLCGAFSLPQYARWKQRFAARMDHPKIAPPNPAEIRRTNAAALKKLWPLLAD
jgi:arginase family enzyme